MPTKATDASLNDCVDAVRIVADENIAHAHDALEQFGDVVLVHGREIDAAIVRGADALLVRSITPVNATLIADSGLKFVGTATIGTDHVDVGLLEREEIGFATAAGAAARSVAEYGIASVLELERRGILSPNRDTIAVIGVGAIGSRLAAFLEILGYETLRRDPPRADLESDFTSASSEELEAATALILAVPLSRSGPHKTVEFVDASLLQKYDRCRVIINVARGAVLRSTDVIDAIDRGKLDAVVLDVWEGEPDVPSELISRSEIATPHIAGYSRDGKLKGTEMMVGALADHFDIVNNWSRSHVLDSRAGSIDLQGYVGRDAIMRAVSNAYDIQADDASLRAALALSKGARRALFDKLRKQYPVRREFPAWEVQNASNETANTLKTLGFTVTVSS